MITLCPITMYGSAKSTCCARSSVIVMPDISTSNLAVSSAGMMPSHCVLTIVSLTPSLRAISLAMSTSKPMMPPRLSRISNGM